MNSIEKLISLSSTALSQGPVKANVMDVSFGSLGKELLGMLERKDGFYAFESALHVFPVGTLEHGINLSQWNSPELWRHEYGDVAKNMFFFAEDAFGNQFCFHEKRVSSFDAETGKTVPLGRTLDEWAANILKDYTVLTGQPLLHEWSLRSGALPAGTRLMPKIPFVLGGEYALDNLYALGCVSAMKTRGNLARQIKDLPDGTPVEFRIIE